MGGKSERVVEYRADPSVIENMNRQHKEMMDHMMKESQRRESELRKIIEEFTISQRKSEENREKLLLLIKESDEKHQNEIMEIMKLNEENFIKLFNSKNSEELEKYKQILAENEKKSKLLEEQIEKLKKETEMKYQEQQKQVEEAIKNAKNEFEREELEKKKKELEEKKLKEEKVFNEFKKQKNNYITEEYEKIMKEFVGNELNFCKEEIQNIVLDKVENLINNIFETENIDEIMFQNVSEHIDKILKNPSLIIEHLNILLLGPSGVGKSTLINAIYKKKKCETGEGEPCTKGEPTYISEEESEGVEKYIRLADSRGIEKGEYGVEKVLNSAKKFINYYLEQKDPDKYVHLIWYCITGTRFEEIERKSLIELSKLYTDDNLPIIVVYTQAWHKQQIPSIKKKLNDNGIKANLVEIIALKALIDTGEKNVEVHPKGVDKLISLSIEKAKNAIGSSCNTALRKNCNNDIIKIIYEKADLLDEQIEQKINISINEIQKGTEISKISNIIGEHIIFIFLEYLNIRNKGLKKNTEKIIQTFVKMCFDEIIKAYQNKLFTIVKEKTETISNTILALQTQVATQYQGNFNISQQMNKEEIYQIEFSDLSKTMQELAEWICIKNAIRYVWQPINITIKNKLSEKYIEYIQENKELEKKFNEYAEEAFNLIGENLKNLKV